VVSATGPHHWSLPRFPRRCAARSSEHVATRNRSAEPRHTRQRPYRRHIRRTHRTRLGSQQNRPRRLSRRISTRPDAAIQHDLAHAWRKELRWFVSTVSAFDVPNLESRLLNRPEGEHDDWCAFLQFSSQTSQTAAPSPSAKHSNCDMSSISWSPTLSCFDGFDFSMGYHVQCETQSECP